MGIVGSGRQIQFGVDIQCQQCLSCAQSIFTAHTQNDIRLEFVQLRQCTPEVFIRDRLTNGEVLCHPNSLMTQLVYHRSCYSGQIQFGVCYQQRTITMIDIAQLPQRHRSRSSFKIDLFRQVQRLLHNSPLVPTLFMQKIPK